MFNFYLRGLKTSRARSGKIIVKFLAQRPHLALSTSSGLGDNVAMVSHSHCSTIVPS